MSMTVGKKPELTSFELNMHYQQIHSVINEFNLETPKENVQATKDVAVVVAKWMVLFLKEYPNWKIALEKEINGILPLIDRCDELLGNLTPISQEQAQPPVPASAVAAKVEAFSKKNLTNNSTPPPPSRFKPINYFQNTAPKHALPPAPAPLPEPKKVVEAAPMAPVVESKPAPAVTVIKVNCQVPAGCILNICGQGGNLGNWEKLFPLTKTSENTWEFRCEGDMPGKFKILLNDKIWENGSDHILEPGKNIEFTLDIAIPFVPVVINYNGSDELFIRGAGPGMSWHEGTKLEKANGKYLFMSGTKPEQPFEFKVLRNCDGQWQWELGENKIHNGETLEYSPIF